MSRGSQGTIVYRDNQTIFIAQNNKASQSEVVTTTESSTQTTIQINSDMKIVNMSVQTDASFKKKSVIIKTST